MSTKSTLFFASICAIALFACKGEDKTAQIIGNWHGTSWSVAGKATERLDADLTFTFEQGGRYSTSYGGQKEAGVFRMDGAKLYTTSDADAKIEKVVMLSKITADTIYMDMNRAGQPEQLVLVRDK
jgi:hypothetical protein